MTRLISCSSALPQVPHRFSGGVAMIGLLVGLALSIAGCGNSGQADSTIATNTTERGPYRLTVTAQPRELTFGDPLTITLTVTTLADTQVTFPPRDAFDPLDVTSPRIDPARATETGELIHTAHFDALPTGTGEVTLPELTVEYTTAADDPNTASGTTNELTSETLTLTVASVLAEGDTITTPRDVTGTLMPGSPPNPWFWPIVIAIVLGIGGVIALLVWLVLKQLRKPAPPIPADVWALRALDRLAVADLVGQGQTQAFYYQLSEIVREYIERQFDIAAPEMTTDEFLVAASRDTQRADVLDTNMLCAFLDACDLVKYAAFVPGQQAIDDALTSARNFVRESTRAKQQAEQAHAVNAAPASQERAA